MTERTYTTRGYAVRAARAALKEAGITDAMSGVHFRLEQAGDEWTWHQIDVTTGDVASGELVEDGVQTVGAIELPLAAGTPPPKKETRAEKHMRKIREADARNAEKRAAKARGETPAPKAPKAKSQPKAGGVVATKVSELLRLVQSPEGLTETQLKAITGWSKFGGFYAAVKEAGLKMERTKVDGQNVWKVAA